MTDYIQTLTICLLGASNLVQWWALHDLRKAV